MIEEISRRSKAVARQYYSRFRHHDYDFEDMEQDAAVGILRAGNAAWGIVDALRVWYGGHKFLKLDTIDVDDKSIPAIPSRIPNPEEAFLKQEREERLWTAVSALAPMENLLLRLRYEDGKGDGEIAQIAGKRVDAIMARLYWSKRHLRDHLV